MIRAGFQAMNNNAVKVSGPRHRNEADGKPCAWCGRDMHRSDPYHGLYATRDHLTPLSTGIADPEQVWACQACNQVRGDMILSDWYKFMRQNPQWWEKWGKRKRLPNS